MYAMTCGDNSMSKQQHGAGHVFLNFMQIHMLWWSVKLARMIPQANHMAHVVQHFFIPPLTTLVPTCVCTA